MGEVEKLVDKREENSGIMTHINKALNDATLFGQLQGLAQAREIALVAASNVAQDQLLFQGARSVYNAISEEYERRSATLSFKNPASSGESEA